MKTFRHKLIDSKERAQGCLTPLGAPTETNQILQDKEQINMQPGKMNLNLLCIRYLTYKNLYLYVLRGVRRVSCPLLKYCV